MFSKSIKIRRNYVADHTKKQQKNSLKIERKGLWEIPPLLMILTMLMTFPLAFFELELNEMGVFSTCALLEDDSHTAVHRFLVCLIWHVDTVQVYHSLPSLSSCSFLLPFTLFHDSLIFLEKVLEKVLLVFDGRFACWTCIIVVYFSHCFKDPLFCVLITDVSCWCWWWRKSHGCVLLKKIRHLCYCFWFFFSVQGMAQSTRRPQAFVLFDLALVPYILRHLLQLPWNECSSKFAMWALSPGTRSKICVASVPVLIWYSHAN